MNPEQRISSIIRQAFAIAAVVLGALTQALQGIHLPVAISAVLAAGGLLLLNLEHYLSDPSTGTTLSTVTTTTTTVPVASTPAPVPSPAPAAVAPVPTPTPAPVAAPVAVPAVPPVPAAPPAP